MFDLFVNALIQGPRETERERERERADKDTYTCNYLYYLKRNQTPIYFNVLPFQLCI